MIKTPGFSADSLDQVNQMLYAEGAPDPLAGQCNQEEKRKQNQQPRTPEQQQADKQRAQEMRGQDNVPSSVRQEAAKKAAETRAKCQKKPATPQQPSTTSTP